MRAPRQIAACRPEHAFRLTQGGAALPFGFGVDEIGEAFDLRQIHLAVESSARRVNSPGSAGTRALDGYRSP